MNVEQLIDAAARAAIEHDRLPDGAVELLTTIRPRADGLYNVPAAARHAYRSSVNDAAESSAGAFRWFNNLMVTITAERDAEAAGLSGPEIGIAGTRAVAAARAKINAAIERGEY